MNIHDVLLARKSVRAFLDKPVERDVIEQIPDAVVNSYRTRREDVHTFTRFFDDTDDKVESK